MEFYLKQKISHYFDHLSNLNLLNQPYLEQGQQYSEEDIFFFIVKGKRLMK